MSNNINTQFMTREEKHLNDMVSTKKIDKHANKENTLSLKTYGGKRFLGLTKAGKPVFVSYEINLSDLKLKMSFTHKLSVLTVPGSVMANDRYTFKIGTKPTMNYKSMTRKLKKRRGGEVTIKTLNHLQRLYELVDINFIKGFVKNKPTKLMFKYVADSIYVDTDVSQYDIMQYWNLPESIYFVPEQAWKYPDEL